MRPTFTAEQLATIPEGEALQFFKDKLGWLLPCPNPYVVQLVAKEGPSDREVIGDQEVGGNNDEHIWLAMRKALGQLPRPARAPAILVVCTNRRGSLAYRPDPVDGRLLGSSVTDGEITSIPHTYRGAFFEKAWSHIGAVVLLDKSRGLEEFSYICTVYLNPGAEEAARCDPSWFRGARVCRIDQGVVRWSPGPPELCVPEGTVIEPDPAEATFLPIAEAWWRDPALGPVIRQLEAQQPEILEAVGEVDRSLIRESLSLPAAARLARSHALARSLEAVSHGRR